MIQWKDHCKIGVTDGQDFKGIPALRKWTQDSNVNAAGGCSITNKNHRLDLYVKSKEIIFFSLYIYESTE